MSDTELTIVGNCDCNIHIQLAFTKTTEAEKDFLKDNFYNGIAISRWDYAKG